MGACGNLNRDAPIQYRIINPILPPRTTTSYQDRGKRTLDSGSVFLSAIDTKWSFLCSMRQQPFWSLRMPLIVQSPPWAWHSKEPESESLLVKRAWLKWVQRHQFLLSSNFDTRSCLIGTMRDNLDLLKHCRCIMFLTNPALLSTISSTRTRRVSSSLRTISSLPFPHPYLARITVYVCEIEACRIFLLFTGSMGQGRHSRSLIHRRPDIICDF